MVRALIKNPLFSFISFVVLINVYVLAQTQNAGGVIRVILTCLLCWALYKRQNWARKLAITLMCLGLIIGGVGGVRLAFEGEWSLALTVAIAVYARFTVFLLRDREALAYFGLLPATVYSPQDAPFDP